MRIAPVAEIKARFSAYLKASEEGPVIVTKNGKPVAVILAMEDEDELESLILAYSPKSQLILQEA
jgi:prevent-host-death family protein